MKDEYALRRAALLKAARSIVRLRHAIAADAELNYVLPAIEKKFDAAVQAGILPEVSALLASFVGGDDVKT